MNIPQAQKVSSLESLVSSIDVDNQVYQWFLLLITRPKVISQLQSSAEITEKYATLKKTFIHQRILLCLFLVTALILIAFKYYLFLPLVLLFFLPLWKVSKIKKESLLAISTYLLKSTFDPETLPTKTLYQISEIFSRDYKIPSLVDAIYIQDNIARKTIIFTFVFTAWIYPLANIWSVFLSVFIAYFTIQALMSTSLFYNNLKITVFNKK